ncbi:MAG: hypothetical protein ACMUIA_06655 [bacterium]
MSKPEETVSLFRLSNQDQKTGGKSCLTLYLKEGGICMRTIAIRSMVMLILIGILTSFAEAGVDFGISVGDDGLRGFYLSVGDYFKVPQSEVIIIKERKIPSEEIPVVLFIAGRANVLPNVIVDLRLGGKSWMDIILRFNLSPEIFYVPVGEVKGPPYGKAYGHFKKHKKGEWKHIVLGDDDVMNLVNLKFTSEYHNCSPQDIIKMRGEGKSFVEIHGKAKEAKTKQAAKGKKGKGKK